MKLARPDVLHPTVVLAGWSQRIAGDGDDVGLAAALRRRGLYARWLSWDDPDVAQADLVILRATHDYASQLDKFLGWTTGVANLMNPPAVVAWNVDRGYLVDLADRGVSTVPGEVYAPGDRVRLPNTDAFFVGPVIGTGTRRCAHRSVALAHAAQLHAAGQAVVVQPGGSAQETALVFVGGEPSHAFIDAAGVLRHAEPEFELWDVGSAALVAAAAQVGVDVGEFLYARVQLSGSRVLELQLVDPCLGWLQLNSDTRELAQRWFARCVESTLERRGLGPLTHRRP